MQRILFRTALIVLVLFIHQIAFAQNKLTKGAHFAHVNGIKIHYYVSGNGPVCLIPTPGWGPSINYLKNSLHPFEKYFTMVYYDTRGSGKSDAPSDFKQYTSKHFMDDMEALRIYLKQPKVWIMGHSMGGFQVLNYGIHHNDKLKGIIAIAAMAGNDKFYQQEFQKMLMKRKDQPYYQKGIKVLMDQDTTIKSMSAGMPYIMPFYFHDVNKVADFVKLDDPELSDHAYENTGKARFGTEYLFPQLKSITVPTLVVVGDDDFICDRVSQADRIAKNISSATEIVIKDAGHFSWIEQPQPFFTDCISWLKKQRLKSSK